MTQARGLSFHDFTRLFLIKTVLLALKKAEMGKGMIEGNFASKNLFYKTQMCVWGQKEDERNYKSFQIDV